MYTVTTYLHNYYTYLYERVIFKAVYNSSVVILLHWNHKQLLINIDHNVHRVTGVSYYSIAIHCQKPF